MISLALLLALIAGILMPAAAGAHTERFTYFENTDYALEVFKIYGREPGATILIIGGIQGDEPTGYLTADLYADQSMKRGNLIVVPRANFHTIIRNTRAINADMNRQFNKTKREEIYEEQVVQVLQELMRESQLLLNLHDGSGFFSPESRDDQVNPKRWGQSLIIDYEHFETEGKKIVPLRDIAEGVVERVNAEISTPQHHFHVKNTRTADPDSPHPEQRLSATFYAVTNAGIPAFGVETSKSINPYSLRMRYQSMVINEFLKTFNAELDLPPVRFDPPQLEFLVLSINRERPIIVKDRETIRLAEGDRIEVEHIQSNYRRGLSVDVAGVGGDSDLHRPLTINKETTILVRKDSLKCGEIHIETERRAPASAAGPVLRVRRNQQEVALRPSDVLDAAVGDEVTLLSIETGSAGSSPVKLNLVGFIPHDQRRDNRGHDLSYPVDTAKDLLPAWSVDKRGDLYRITATQSSKEIGQWFLRLSRPQVRYLLVEINGTRTWFTPDESIRLHDPDEIKIIDVESNLPNSDGLTVNFRGYRNPLGSDDRGVPIRRDQLLPEFSTGAQGREYRILISNRQLLIAELRVDYP
ncbi:MAG: succinylglutamate desuccinylase/aspartoacylase family protein [Nitrospirae bacterium]|nr:succinylglutamate desuccinylase/aspartoacylase family protein [Nitrospirota bacterium]